MTTMERPTLFSFFIVFFLVGVLTKFCVIATAMPDGTAIVWAPNAVLLSALLRYRGQRGWLFALLALIAETIGVLPENSFSVAVYGGFVNIAEPIIAYWLCRRLGVSETLSTTRDIVRFILSAPLGGAVVAGLLGAVVIMLDSGESANFLEVARLWWFADALGLLIFTPLFLALGQARGWRIGALRRGDWLMTILTLALVVLVFSARQGDVFGATITPTLLLPSLLYIATRCHPRWTALAVALLSMAVATAVGLGREPFGGLPTGLTMVHAQEYILITGILGMGFSVLMAQIRAHNRTLETRVEERTHQLHAQAEDLRVARDQAEEATRAKSSFLAVMSHEIRTPMNGVTAMAEMLDQTDLTDDQHGMIEVINASAQSLLTIINDILDFSKIEAGKLEIEAIPLSLTDLVEEAAELVAGRAEEKALHLIVDIGEQTPDRLLGDPTRLRQVLVNLVSNAIKFTETGGVSLRVRALSCDADRTRLRFEIADTGIGLTAEQSARLFQPFQQADSSTSRRFGGTGLGLTICHRLCDMMGGAIGVNSVHGEGSTFWFEVPFTMVAPEPLVPAIAIDDAVVVAVGFTGDGRAALAGILRSAGVNAVTWIGYEDDPVAALSIADRQDSPSHGPVVILHAEENSETALAYGQSLITAKLAAKPSVMLATSRSLASTLDEANRIGLFCTLTLPLRRRRLWQAVAAALGRADLERRASRRDLDSTGWEPPSIDEAMAAGALILVAEDNPINQTVIRRMLNQRGYAIEIADNGAQALALHQPGRYGLLLTDFHMPEMDGFALTHAIREREQRLPPDGGGRLPIVALTADALSGTAQRCLDAGMDGYLTKPIDSRLLADTLDRFLPHAKSLRRHAETTTTASTATPRWSDADIDPAIFDLAQLAQNFAPDDPAAMRFLNDFLALTPGLIQKTTTALETKDADAARDAIHTLKGSSLSIGAARLGQLASDAQDALDAGDFDTAALLASLLTPTHDELCEATATIRGFFLPPLPL
jgi:signal transduction histidine kinase/CheY-like chemotaxis protein/HPt (histidine-containing phosphotransfer) domain-containing protein